MTEEIVRKKIKLTTDQLRDLVFESGYIPEGSDEFIKFETVENKYDSGTRHTEVWVITVKSPDGEYYQTSYETSVKDSMGWDECNGYHDGILTQVFPHEKTIIEYK